MSSQSLSPSQNVGVSYQSNLNIKSSGINNISSAPLQTYSHGSHDGKQIHANPQQPIPSTKQPILNSYSITKKSHQAVTGNVFQSYNSTSASQIPDPNIFSNINSTNLSNSYSLPNYNTPQHYGMKSAEDKLSAENLALRKQLMDLNALNFNLKSTISKNEADNKIIADSRLLELQSQLKFKNEDVKTLRKELQATKQKLALMKRDFDEMQNSHKINTSNVQSSVIAAPNASLSNSQELNRSRSEPTIDIKSQSPTPHQSSLSSLVHSRKKIASSSSSSSYIMKISNLSTTLLRICSKIINTSTSEDSQAANLQIVVSKFTNSFSRFVGYSSINSGDIYIAELFHLGVIITSHLIGIASSRIQDIRDKNPRALKRKLSSLPFSSVKSKKNESKSNDDEESNAISNEVVLAILSSLSLLQYLIQVRGVDVLCPHYIQEKSDDNQSSKQLSLTKATSSVQSIEDQLYKAMHLPSNLSIPNSIDGDTLAVHAPSQKYIVNSEFKQIVDIIESVVRGCVFNWICGENTSRHIQSLLENTADFVVEIFSSWQRDIELTNNCNTRIQSNFGGSNSNVHALSHHMETIFTRNAADSIPIIFLLINRENISSDRVLEVLRVATIVLDSDRTGEEAALSWMNVRDSPGKSFILDLCDKFLFSHRFFSQSQQKLHMKMASFILSLLRKACGMKVLFNDHNSIQSSMTDTTASKSTLSAHKSKSIFIQKLSSKLVFTLREANSSLPESMDQSSVSLGEMVCALLIRICEQLGAEERREMFASADSLLRVQSILLSRSQNLKNLQTQLYSLHKLLS